MTEFMEKEKSEKKERCSFPFFLSVLIWLLAVGAGEYVLLRYQMTFAATQTAPEIWPAQSTLQRFSGMPTLIMIAHPHCPCTRASIEEMAQLMTGFSQQVKAYVLFVKSKENSENWVQTDLWKNASKIPGVFVLEDEEKQEAERFHFSTSGETLLYDSAGRLVFQGGITPSRGHLGDSTGRTAIASFLSRGIIPVKKKAFVFGCSLRNDVKDLKTG